MVFVSPAADPAADPAGPVEARAVGPECLAAALAAVPVAVPADLRAADPECPDPGPDPDLALGPDPDPDLGPAPDPAPDPDPGPGRLCLFFLRDPDVTGLTSLGGAATATAGAATALDGVNLWAAGVLRVILAAMMMMIFTTIEYDISAAYS